MGEFHLNIFKIKLLITIFWRTKTTNCNIISKSYSTKIIILDKTASVLYLFGKDGVFEICKRMKKELDMNITMVEHKIDILACL